MGDSGIRYSGYDIRIYFPGISLSQHITTVITHFLYVDSFVCRSRITIVNPEERTDTHFLARFLQCFHTFRGNCHDLARSQLFQILISQIQICKTLKRNATGILFFTNNQWCSSQTVTGCKQTFRCQEQHGHGTFNHFLCIADSLDHVLFLIDQGSYQFRRIDISTTHLQEMCTAIFKTGRDQFVHIVDLANCSDGKISQVRTY